MAMMSKPRLSNYKQRLSGNSPQVKKLRQEAQRQRGVPVPNTIEVPGDLPTIAAAISAAADGDVINIAPAPTTKATLTPAERPSPFKVRSMQMDRWQPLSMLSNRPASLGSHQVKPA